jgi:endonuclease/exonuclease/phosphatase family metal-dependent hydrolase
MSLFAARLFTFLALASSTLAAEPVTLRVMSYNIHHGEGLDGKLDLARIAQVIIDAKADIVGLQEVDRGTERTQRRDLPAELAKLTGLTVRFDRNIPHQGGDYGNAVLTRFPIKRATNTPLKSFANGEQRGVQQLVLDIHGREILFLNTHLDARRDPTEREHSATELRVLVQAAGAMPVILVGDFNAAPDAKSIAPLREVLADTWPAVNNDPGFTIPVKKPTRRIDYIWITPGAITPVSMAVPYSEASDHLPIVAVLRLEDGAR